MALASLLAVSLLLGAGAVMAHPTTHLLDTHAGGVHAVGHTELPALGLPTDRLWWAGFWLVAGLGLWRLAACRRRGRMVALGLSLLLGVFAMESAVHSVHHLADPETAAACPVLSGSQHLTWGEVAAVASSAPPLCAALVRPLRAEEPAYSLVYRPHQERAPPA